MMFLSSSDSTMVSEKIIEIEKEKNISDTPADTIPESILIPTEHNISTQFINDNSTIISANNTPRVDNLPTSCNEKNNEPIKISINSMSPYLNSTLADFAQAINVDDYLLEDASVKRELSQLTGTTQRYVKEKAVIVKRFFEILSKNKTLGFLATAIPDPQDKHLQTMIFMNN